MAVMQRIRSVMCPVRRRAAALWHNCDGLAVIEFAIVGPAFIALVLVTLHLMLIFLAQQMLETAAEGAGRLLLTGTAQTSTLSNGHNGMTAADFKETICNGNSGTNARGEAITISALLPSMLTCSRLTVNVATANSYSSANTNSPTFTYDSDGVVTSTGTGYNSQSGGQGQNRIIVLQLIYLWPTGTGPLGLDFSDQPLSNRMLVATSVFTAEDYTCNSSQTSC